MGNSAARVEFWNLWLYNPATMAGLPNLETVGGRVAHLRGVRGVKTPAELHRLVEKTGYGVRRQTLAALERNAIQRPRAGLIHAIAVALHAEDQEDYLLHGPRQGETQFSNELSGLLVDLTEPQQDQLLLLANEMAKETRARREEATQQAVTEQEGRLLEAVRAAPSGTLEALLQQAQRATTTPTAAETSAVRTPRPRRRSGRQAS